MIEDRSGKPRVVLGTHNPHKVEELRRILEAGDFAVDLVGVDAFPDVPDVAETGATFAENALLKAHAVAAATGLPSVADDSGLCVDALNGMPGVLSARWAGPARVDSANLQPSCARPPWRYPTAPNTSWKAASTGGLSASRGGARASGTTRSSSRPDLR
jgi:Ham1 family